MKATSNPITPSLLALIFALIALMQMSVDLYTPSFPALTKAFLVDLSEVQLSLSIFMLGFGFSHLILGPWSDKVGRRIPLILGVGINVVGSAVCLFSPTIHVFLIGRFLQGLGIGSGNSVGRSLARDLLSSSELSKLGSQIGMTSVLFLALSPTLGGFIQEQFGWRGNFVLLLAMGGMVFLALCFYLPETNYRRDQRALSLSTMKKNYYTLLKNPVFMGYTLCSCLAGASLFVYLAIAPFLFQQKFGLSPAQFGSLAFVIAGGIFLSGLINYYYVSQKGIQFMVLFGCTLMIAASLFLLISSLLGVASVLFIMISMSVLSLGCGLIFMNAFAGAFDLFPHIAGTAGALYAFLQDTVAAMASSMIAAFNITSQLLLACIISLLSLLSLFCFCYLIQFKAALIVKDSQQ